jgi:GDP-L-fucose synthase
VFEEYKGKTCLVTGGTGMLGRQVVSLLLAVGAEVKTASLDRLRLWDDIEHFHMDLRIDVENFYMDLRIERNCRIILDQFQPEYVFHLAGIKSNPTMTKTKPLSFFLPMAQMNLSFLGACAEAGVERLTYTSSVGAYGRGAMSEARWVGCGAPQDGYPGWSKRIGEMVAEAVITEKGLRWATIRLSNTYGPGDNFDPETAMVVGALMGKALRGDDPVIVAGNGSAVRDFLYSEDAAKAVLLAGLDTKGWWRVNVGGQVGHSIKTLVSHLSEITGSQFQFETFGGPNEGTRILPLKRALERGWKPEVGLLDGLRRTWSWLLQHPDEYLRKRNFLKSDS